jgi:hypothetical protein
VKSDHAHGSSASTPAGRVHAHDRARDRDRGGHVEAVVGAEHDVGVAGDAVRLQCRLEVAEHLVDRLYGLARLRNVVSSLVIYFLVSFGWSLIHAGLSEP